MTPAPFDDELVTVDFPYTRNGTTVTFTGISEDGERRVTFAADWRPSQGVIEALYRDELPLVSVAGWQILSTEPVDTDSPFPGTEAAR